MNKLQEINEQYLFLEEKVNQKDFLSRKLEEARKRQEVVMRNSANLKRQLKKEQADVDKLNKTNISSIFASITGKKGEKLEKEQRELIEAKLAYEQGVQEQSELMEEINTLKNDINNLEQYEKDYTRLRKDKLALLQEVDPRLKDKIAQTESDLNYSKSQLLELRQANNIGKAAIGDMNAAEKELELARKHAKKDVHADGSYHDEKKMEYMDIASMYITYAKAKVERFNKELYDVHVEGTKSKIELAEMDTLFDRWFDNYWANKDTLRSIESSIESIWRLRKEVQMILDELTQLKHEHTKIVKDKEKEIEDILNAN